jgi:acetyltransferase-like isoleucine patch superfamily enzyme
MRYKLNRVLLKLLNASLNFKHLTELNALKKNFKKVGRNFNLKKDFRVINPQYIEIGDNFQALERFRIETIDKHWSQTFTPSINIGNNVIFNTDIHIGCIDSIEIEDNCLFASRIFITDHNHGDTSLSMRDISPVKRPLISNGPVVIKKNVWVGEGVVIMPNVTIGENSIIAANAVVTKNVPQNVVVAGIPAVIIKQMK